MIWIPSWELSLNDASDLIRLGVRIRPSSREYIFRIGLGVLGSYLYEAWNSCEEVAEERQSLLEYLYDSGLSGEILGVMLSDVSSGSWKIRLTLAETHHRQS